MFQFKQFSIDQQNCAMKINTDGVLLGALAMAHQPQRILDIGTGTGVIALMLAQKYDSAEVDAVEIDLSAAQTAKINFEASKFSKRMRLFACSFETYFEQNIKGYDLIVSNPPFYIDALKSPGEKKTLAKHADHQLFEKLIKGAATHLNPDGVFWLIIPFTMQAIVNDLATENQLFTHQIIDIKSYPDDNPHRVIICFGINDTETIKDKFVIYQMQGVYSNDYKSILQPYFLAF